MFDPIASDWKRVRAQPWQLFTDLAEPIIESWNTSKSVKKELPPYLGIDLGGGTGRHLEFFREHGFRLVELDISFEMLRNLPQDTPKIHASMEYCPFRENQFSGIFAIASIHHIRGQLNRINCVKEINRIGSPNALVFITVWRLYQQKFKDLYKSSLLTEWIQKSNDKKETSGAMSERGDTEINWTVSDRENTKYPRFYHLFLSPEFLSLIAPFKKIKRCTMGKKHPKENFFFAGKIEK
jgi:hypothetical protein